MRPDITSGWCATAARSPGAERAAAPGREGSHRAARARQSPGGRGAASRRPGAPTPRGAGSRIVPLGRAKAPGVGEPRRAARTPNRCSPAPLRGDSAESEDRSGPGCERAESGHEASDTGWYGIRRQGRHRGRAGTRVGDHGVPPRSSRTPARSGRAARRPHRGGRSRRARRGRRAGRRHLHLGPGGRHLERRALGRAGRRPAARRPGRALHVRLQPVGVRLPGPGGPARGRSAGGGRLAGRRGRRLVRPGQARW